MKRTSTGQHNPPSSRTRRQLHSSPAGKSNQNSAQTFLTTASMDSAKTKRKPHKGGKKGTPKNREASKKASNVLSIALREGDGRAPAWGECEGGVSFREYVAVGGHWVPLLTPTQRDRITLPSQEKPVQEQKPATMSQSTQGVTILEAVRVLEHEMGNWDIFSNISNLDKAHACRVLQSAVEKLTQAQHQQFLNICTPAQQASESSDHEHVQPSNSLPDSSTSQLKDQHAVRDVKPHQLECLQPEPSARERGELQTMLIIKKREQHQLSLFPGTASESLGFNTGVGAIGQFFRKLQRIMQDSRVRQQMLSNLQISCGMPKRQKLASLQNSNYYELNAPVIPSLVLAMLKSMSPGYSEYQEIHDRCLLDATNCELYKFKPYYQSDGESFPWSMKLGAPLTFYQIEQDSLGLMLDQVQTQIADCCSGLCGVLVELQAGCQFGYVLEARRKEREELVLRRGAGLGQEPGREEGELENEATRVLLAVAEQIVQFMVEEAARCLPLL